jgi:putative DNA primase/helicase
MSEQALEIWRAGLLQTKDETTKASEANASIILRCSERWAGRLRYNEFTGQAEWRSRAKVPWAEIRDCDIVTVQEELQRAESVTFGIQILHLAVEHACMATPHHPVREYIEELEWDGEPRLTSWLQTYLGAEQTQAPVGKWWMISAVARVMRPGCKADHMIVLEGPQGLGKSTAMSILGGEWYSETLSDLSSGKDAYQDLAGAWLIEIAELDALRGAAGTRIKRFLSTSRDKYRPSYGRRSTYHQRQCVFAGTTNEGQYLEDTTGARRIWPVRCSRLDVDGLTGIRDQLWAEARWWWGAGAPWWPTDREDMRALAEDAEERRVGDPWEAELASWLADRAAAGDELTTHEVLRKLEIQAKDRTRREEMRAARVLRGAGWDRAPRSRSDGRQRRWRYQPSQRGPTQ